MGVYGPMFRLDDIIFRKQDVKRLGFPNLMEPGPRYAQLFEPYQHLFMADYHPDGKLSQVSDLLLEPSNFISDPDKIRDAWIADLSNFRVGSAMAEELKGQGMLEWNLTVGGYGVHGTQAFMIRPLPVNPYDDMPTYIFTHCSCISVIKTYGKPHYRPEQSFTLESALWNCGIITFRPKFEGIFEPVVICTDDRGLSASDSVRIYWVNPGSWLNHCPIIYIKTSKPLVMRAGEEFILSPTDLNIIDPDGDKIYGSCNIGAV